MAKYKFQNHQSELENPVIERVRSSFEIGDEHVSVTATLNANGNRLFWVELGFMPNTENWTDEDLQSFATQELEKYKV